MCLFHRRHVLTDKGKAAFIYLIKKYIYHTINYTINDYEELIDKLQQVFEDNDEYPCNLPEKQKRSYVVVQYIDITLSQIKKRQRQEMLDIIHELAQER